MPRRWRMRISFTRKEVLEILRRHGLEVRKIRNHRHEKPSMILAMALNEEMLIRAEEENGRHTRL
jgi:hypothetical protein